MGTKGRPRDGTRKAEYYPEPAALAERVVGGLTVTAHVRSCSICDARLTDTGMASARGSAALGDLHVRDQRVAHRWRIEVRITRVRRHDRHARAIGVQEENARHVLFVILRKLL